MALIKNKEDFQRFVLEKLVKPPIRDNQLMINLKQRLSKNTIKSPFTK
jgi:hypothetical protein